MDEDGPCLTAELVQREPALCRKHYMRIRRRGLPKKSRKNARGTCTVIEDGQQCTAPAVAKGLCWKHRSRFVRTGTTDLIPYKSKVQEGSRRSLIAQSKEERRCKSCAGQIPSELHGRAEYCCAECRDRGDRLSMRRADLRRLYGLTLEQYDDILERQGWRCPVCAEQHPGKGDYSWAVDHCHATGQVRGILTPNCNKGLGLLGDNARFLRAGIQYLEADRGLPHPALLELGVR